jgi:S-sulfo-L-cysteine synthase (3-phospho-L-serine-dependent)
VLSHSKLDAIGGTPLVRLDLDVPTGTEVYAKLELANPFGMKDRVAKSVVERARRAGVLPPGAPIVESSSGTMALGLVLVGGALGHPVHIVTDPRIDETTLIKLRAMDAQVHIVPAMTGGGWQSARLEFLQVLLRELPGAFWPRQYTNPDNPRAYHELADELLHELETVDILVGSVGSGGSLCGSTRALRRSVPRLRSVGVDCVGSTLFDQPDYPRRLQSGLGNSLLPHNLDRGLIDEVHWLNDHEAFAATRALAREQQIFAGNTSGSVYRVLTEVARRARPGSRIVGIFPDRGDRYAGTVYNDDYWAAHKVTDLPLALEPATVPYGTEVRQWSRAELSGSRAGPRRLLFIESNTTGTGMLALHTTRRLGYTPVLITDSPGRYTGLAGTDVEVLRCDTNSPGALRIAIQERFPREDIAGITSTSDFYVRTAADLAGWMGLPGNPAAAVAACRDKAAARRLLEAAGVQQPRHAEVTSVESTAAATERLGLPCVVKPVDDSGSRLVRLCTTVGEAVRQVERILAVESNVRGQAVAKAALVEEYIDAPEYSVEIFTIGGVHHCVGVTAKTVTPGPAFVETQHLFPAELSPAVAARIEATAVAAVKAVGWTLGATHVEVKATLDDTWVVEVNPRLAGGMIPELVRIATGTDLLEQQIRAAVDLPVYVAPARSGVAGIRFLLAGHHGVVRAIEGQDAARAIPAVTAVTLTCSEGDIVSPPEDAYGRLGHVIARGGSTDDVLISLDTASRLLKVRIGAELRPNAKETTT